MSEVVELPATWAEVSTKYDKVWKKYEESIKWDLITPGMTETEKGVLHFSMYGSYEANRPPGSLVIMLTGAHGLEKTMSLLTGMDQSNFECAVGTVPKVQCDRVPVSVQTKNHSVKGSIVFLRVPEFTQPENVSDKLKMCDMHSLRGSLPDIAKISRLDIDKPYPNLVILTLSVVHQQIGDEFCSFLQHIRALHEVDLIDSDKNNLIVLLTDAHALSLDADEVHKTVEEIGRLVKTIVWREFNVLDVPIYCDKTPPMSWGSTEFKRDECLLTLMLNCTRQNDDLIGNLFMTQFFQDESKSIGVLHPEKVVFQNVLSKLSMLFDYGQKLYDYHLQIGLGLRSVHPVRTGREVSMEMKWFGNGFCPVTEKSFKINKVDFVKTTTYCKCRFAKSKPFIERDFCETQSDYEAFKHARYNLDTDMKLSVRNLTNQKWFYPNTSCSERIIRFRLELELYHLDLVLHNKFHLKYFTDEFQESFESLPDVYNEFTKSRYLKFFLDWGTHVVIEQSAGGIMFWDYLFDSQTEGDVKNREKIILSDWYKDKVLCQLKRMMDFRFCNKQLCHWSMGGECSNQLTGLENVEIWISMFGELRSLRQWDHLGFSRWTYFAQREPSVIGTITKIKPYYKLLPYGVKYKHLRRATVDYISGNSLNVHIRDTHQSRPYFCTKSTVLMMSDETTAPISDEELKQGTSLRSVLMNKNNVDVDDIWCDWTSWWDELVEQQLECVRITCSNGSHISASPEVMIWKHIPREGFQPVPLYKCEIGDDIGFLGTDVNLESVKILTFQHEVVDTVTCYIRKNQSVNIVANGFLVSLDGDG